MMQAMRSNGTKLGGLIFIVLLVSAFIFFLAAGLAGTRLEHKEIHKVIESMGGEVKTISKTKLEDSPFAGTMASRDGKRAQYPNTFYKIVYVKSGETHAAWYRTAGGIFTIKGKTIDMYNKPVEETPENKHLIKSYGEKWIFE